VTNQWGLTQFKCESQNFPLREIPTRPRDPPSTAKKKNEISKVCNEVFSPEDVMGIGEDMCYLKSKVETYQRSQHDLIHRLRKENDGLWRQNETLKEFETNYQREISL
jgi:hypothetical protein